jgi:glutathione synthase/RimK-type ligase-like ATP-grasp enzyme
MQNLLAKVNSQLNQTPLIYVCIEVERALGLETLLSNYHIICYEDSAIIDQLLAQGVSVHCLAREASSEQIRKTTAAMLGSEFVRQLIGKITNGNKFLLQTFYPTAPFFFQAKTYNCAVLNNDPRIGDQYMDKFQAAELLNKRNVPVPQFFIADINEQSWTQLLQQLGSPKIVLQNHKSHTGLGTYIVNSEAEFSELQSSFAHNQFKFSRFVTGDSWTINGCIAKDQIYIHGLSFQITGVPQLTNYAGSTVGNDWAYASKLPTATLESVMQITRQVGEIMQLSGYRGLYGIDFVIGEQVYVIEINARQTANMPMQSYLELRHQLTPLQLLHLSEFLDIQPGPINYSLTDLQGAQVFNRAKRDLTISSQLPVGTYRLQSDNSARDWDNLEIKDGVVFLDEEQDKPLIYQNPSYNITQINSGGFQLLISAQGDYKQNEEICRLQMPFGVVSNGQVIPWVLEAMAAIADKLQ